MDVRLLRLCSSCSFAVFQRLGQELSARAKMAVSEIINYSMNASVVQSIAIDVLYTGMCLGIVLKTEDIEFHYDQTNVIVQQSHRQTSQAHSSRSKNVTNFFLQEGVINEFH